MKFFISAIRTRRFIASSHVNPNSLRRHGNCSNPLLLIAGIVGFGLVTVVAPIAIDAFRRYRYQKVITCPEACSLAEVSLEAGQAALGVAVGRPVLRVRNCSLWPKRKGCEEKCVGENWPAP
jgi:hypothetical protein